MNNPRIFISYSLKDREVAEGIHNQLEAAGFNVWRDQTRLETYWSQEISYALADADVLCLIWSRHAAATKWVKHEWLTARALEKQIIPLLFPGAPALPKALRNIHGITLDIHNLVAARQIVVQRLRTSAWLTKSYNYSVLPVNTYMPFNPNPHFTGRLTDLLELYKKMIGSISKIGINPVGIVGMAGIGKTQLAVEFAYRFSFAFDSIYWIYAADTDQWRSQFVELARDRLQLTIADPDNPLADKHYIFALKKYCSKHNTLIIMDNVIEPKSLNNDAHLSGLTPRTLGCNLLFTTRENFQLHGVTMQAINVLSPEAAYTLLTDFRKPETPEEANHARSICRMVGYIPLGITLVGTYLISYQNVSFVDYHEKLRTNILDVIGKDEVSQENIIRNKKLSKKEDQETVPVKLIREINERLDRLESDKNTGDEEFQERSVFLSYRFLELEYIEGLKGLLDREGFTVVTAERTNTYISQAILSRIKSSEFFLCLMTKAVEKSNGKYTTSPWLLEEKGAAIAYGKKIIIMIENGVEDIGGLQGDWQQIHFSPKGFTMAALQAIEQIKSYI